VPFAFVGSTSAYTAGATELDWTATVPVGDLLVAVYAFQGVAAGSGPWSIPNIGQFAQDHIGPSSAWELACWQAPASTGVGIEVWVAVNSASGAGTRKLPFVTSQQCQVSVAWYSGQYSPNGTILDGPVRVATTAQVTGNRPAAPSVAAGLGELIVAIGGDLMTVSKFGSPSGFTTRVDAAGGGAGNVDAAIADAVAAIAGSTGLIAFPNNAASTSTQGATATLLIRPATTAGIGAPILDVPMPAELDLADGWTLRVTALDPDTGAQVSGVQVSNLAIAVDLGAGTNPADLAVGPYLLVPGEGA